MVDDSDSMADADLMNAGLLRIAKEGSDDFTFAAAGRERKGPMKNGESGRARGAGG
jgi:hypothetical protein